MSTHAIHLIGAASALGAPDVHAAEAPERLRARLAAHGKLNDRLVWHKLLRAPAGKPARGVAAALLAFSRQLARTVRASLAGGARFVVVGGDHSCALGTWSGAAAALRAKTGEAAAPLGLIWIDAHMDAHTPQTSPSGNAHGMPLAYLLGAGSGALARLNKEPPLSAAHVCLIGVHSFEPAEAALLERLGVRVYRIEEVRVRGMAAVMEEVLARVRAGSAGFGVSIDLDAVDPHEAPAVSTPAAGGLRAEEAVAALGAAAQQPGFIGAEIAEFDPPLDRDGRTGALAERLIDTVAGARSYPLDASVALEARYLAHNYEPLPVVLTRGKGVYVWGTDGRRYLDMMAAYSAVSFGHANPRLLRALTRQARRLTLVSRAYYTDRLGPLAQRLCELTGFARMLPMNTGAEAVETAVKAARKWAYKLKRVPEGRAEIISCAGNFHGRTMTAVTMSSEPQYRDGFAPFLPGFVRIPFADAAALEAAITPNTAAFLVEPVQGEGGIIVPPAGYLARCAEICRRHNVLLLCDEVQTGLGRTGKLLACEHDGVKPDGIILGKALGGGMVPISAFLAREEVMSVFTPGDHGSTFGGNPLACAVALEALGLLTEERLVERAAELGDYLLRRLHALRSPLVRAVRGQGLFAGIEIDPARAEARSVCETLLRHGILTKDTHVTVLRFAPPLTITTAQLDEAIEGIRRALEESDAARRRGAA
jgi:ornithine--oxo-acid transaminase